MNIELDEVVVQDVSDESLEQAAGVAQGGPTAIASSCWTACSCLSELVLAPADR